MNLNENRKICCQNDDIFELKKRLQVFEIFDDQIKDKKINFSELSDNNF